jgi:hypothetical protein
VLSSSVSNYNLVPSQLFLPDVLLFTWVGVRLSPLGKSATNWLIVSAPGDRL